MTVNPLKPTVDCCSSQCSQSAVQPLVEPVNPFWLNWGLFLVSLTVLYNLAEAGIALYSGFKAKSIALEGFGLDSFIEVSAAGLMLWRLILQHQGASDAVVEASEAKVHRFVGVSFLLLSVYILVESCLALFNKTQPEQSLTGLILAALSIVIMPLLAWGKLKVAHQIRSAALRAEAKETVACSVLSLILLVGLGLHAWFGWWWADPVASLAMLPWLIREGLAGLRGEGCCG